MNVLSPACFDLPSAYTLANELHSLVLPFVPEHDGMPWQTSRRGPCKLDPGDVRGLADWLQSVFNRYVEGESFVHPRNDSDEETFRLLNHLRAEFLAA